MVFKIKNEKDLEAVKKYLDSLKITKPITVEIKKSSTVRSKDQNNLYWLWVACLSDETGNDKDTIHEFLKAKFLGFKEENIFDAKLVTVKTTTSLSEKEMYDFLKNVEIWASTELEMTLPRPEDLIFEAFCEKYN